MKIRALDIDDDREKYYKLLQQLTDMDTAKITQENFADQIKLILSNPNHKIIIMTLNDEIIGSITILIEPKIIHGLSKVAHIEDVIVDKNYRSQNIGTRLMEYVVNIAKKENCYKVILNCGKSNIGFYKKIGFNIKNYQMDLRLKKNN